MVIIGLLMLIAAVVFGLDVVWKNNFHIVSPTAFGQSLNVNSADGLFVMGVITGAGLLLGISLLVSGVRHKTLRAGRRRGELRAARASHVEHREPVVESPPTSVMP